MKILRTLFSTLTLATVLTMQAAVPAGYYSGLEGKCGAALKKAAKAASGSPKTVSYGDATWTAFKKTDVRNVNGQLCWWDMYSNNNVPVSSGHPGMNIEHSVANSWWDHTKNDAYKDLFHLNPSDQDANSRKSNYPLGEIDGSPKWTNGVTSVGKPKSGQGGGNSMVYEPADQYKGDFARVFFYMFTVYDNIGWMDKYDWMYDKSSELTLKPWAYRLLLQWAKDDPVDQKEIDRNEAIYSIQKNRNPYIDNPDLAEYIWGSKNNTPYHSGDNPNPDPDPDPDPDPNPNPGGNEIWEKVTSQTQLTTEDFYIIADSEQLNAMSANLSGKFMARCDGQLNDENGIITKTPDDIAIIKLARSGNGYALGVGKKNTDGRQYICSTVDKTISLSDSPSSDGASASITISSGQATIDYGTAGKLQYNASAPRFLTYKSEQKPLAMYKLKDSGINATTVDSLNVHYSFSGNMLYAPQGTEVYDITGRKVGEIRHEGINLYKGMFILKLNGSKPVKIMIR